MFFFCIAKLFWLIILVTVIIEFKKENFKMFVVKIRNF